MFFGRENSILTPFLLPAHHLAVGRINGTLAYSVAGEIELSLENRKSHMPVPLYFSDEL